MRVEFEVSDALPPKKDGASSMWSKESEVDRLVALRRGAMAANARPVVLQHRIRLSLEVHVPNPESRAAGDLDNFITGVCDGLMRAAQGVRLADGWADPAHSDVHPGIAAAIHDDAAVVEIAARKLEEPTGRSWYRVALEGEE